MVDSDNKKTRNINQRALQNLKSVAEDIRDNMMVSYCDVSKQALSLTIIFLNI